MKDEYFVKCDSCGKEYVYESSPMIRDELWESISNEGFDDKGVWHGQLFCLDCIEKKLGRKLTKDDISPYIDAEHNKYLKDIIK